MSLSHKAVSSLYDEICGYYELVNSLLTLGLDRYWRKRAAFILSGSFDNCEKILDICCGTGDFTEQLIYAFGGDKHYFACDLNKNMLSKAEKRLKNVSFSLADCSELPYGENEFDLITVSFAARNIFLNREDYKKVSEEILRVLKKGGKFAILETTVPENTILAKIMFFFVSVSIKAVTLLMPASASSYGFLKNTIINFKTAKDLSQSLLNAGFSKVSYKILFPGSTALHICEK
ncbi:MAG: ubiquinone/menaquinone biosynthesis methyltransferase [Elusimicrobia bacterium]|nr:ubiquinone/menaquinone biosynthesis methyltransferase [Elusimicrobiota bacterium]